MLISQTALQKPAHYLRNLRRSAKAFDTSLAFQLTRFRYAHSAALFSLEEFLIWGLGNPELDRKSLRWYLSREVQTRVRERVNSLEGQLLADDKERFWHHYRKHGLPMPPTLGIWAPQHVTVDGESPRVSLRSLEPGDYVFKPVGGWKGEGLAFLSVSTAGWQLGEEPVEPEQAEARLAAGHGARYIVQRRLSSHPAIVALTQSDALQSARITTFLDASDRVNILFSRFKFARAGNRIDNFAGGSTGNLVAAVDSASGQITAAYCKRNDIGIERVNQHPDSGGDLLVQLPDWPQAIELVHKAASALPRARALGWDIGFSADGPVIIEANPEFEAFPIAPYDPPHDLEEWARLLARS